MRNYYRILSSYFKLAGVQSYCPVCQKFNAGFNPLPEFYKLNAEKYNFKYFSQVEMTAEDTYSCRNCGASDRERLYAWWLSEVISKTVLTKKLRAIHFAPEPALSEFIKSKNLFCTYHTADLSMRDVDYTVDLLDLPFENESYDFFICSHVLEHVTDDCKAISELYRITKGKGMGILMVPIVQQLPTTIEDPTILEESERWRLFGQYDHVRLYARNEFISRSISAGFSIVQFDALYFGLRIFTKLGLKLSSVLYVVTKL